MEYVRLNLLTADPALLDKLTTHLEHEVRPPARGQGGSGRVRLRVSAGRLPDERGRAETERGQDPAPPDCGHDHLGAVAVEHRELNGLERRRAQRREDGNHRERPSIRRARPRSPPARSRRCALPSASPTARTACPCPGHSQVVWMDDRSREQGGAREGQQGPGQGQDVGGPGRRRAEAHGAGARQRRPGRGTGRPTWWSDAGGNGASRRIRWTATAFQAVVITLARTAIIVPADPAKAAAVGTTQKLALGVTAHASSELWPALRSPRETRVAPRRSHMPAARARGPSNWLTEVSRQAATRDSVADVARIWTRRKTGQARCTAGPAVGRTPADEPTHNEPHQGEHTPIVAAAAAPARPS